MKIIVNGATKEFPDGQTLKQILTDLAIDSSYVAIAVNQSCIPRSQYPGYVLQNGDDIEIVSPMVGG